MGMAYVRQLQLSGKAARYVRRGHDAEKRGDFATAAIWYRKASVLYKRAKSKTRARLWAARAKDVKKERKMGTLYRGPKRDPNKDLYNVTIKQSGTRGMSDIVVGHVRASWIGEAQDKATAKFGKHAQAWSASGRHGHTPVGEPLWGRYDSKTKKTYRDPRKKRGRKAAFTGSPKKRYVRLAMRQHHLSREQAIWGWYNTLTAQRLSEAVARYKRKGEAPWKDHDYSRDPRKRRSKRGYPQKRCKVGVVTQSVVFSRKRWASARAKAWLKKKGFKTGKLDSSRKGELRYRQLSPSSVKVVGGKEIKPGVRLVLGCPKRSKKSKRSRDPSEERYGVYVDGELRLKTFATKEAAKRHAQDLREALWWNPHIEVGPVSRKTHARSSHTNRGIGGRKRSNWRILSERRKRRRRK